jgi:uncharacterized damage-inducible protein DinB
MQTSDLRRINDYLDWANTVTLDAVAALPHDVLHADVGISFRSIFGTLVHVFQAERGHFGRWSGREDAAPSAPEDLAALRVGWEALATERLAWFGALGEDAPTRVIRWRMRDADHVAALENLVLHVMTHSTMHRGQVIGMMRQAGVTPPATGLRNYVALKG